MSLAKTLSVSTPTDLEIAVEREFDAPPDLVFACYTQPELVKRWLTGPEGWRFETCDIDLRVGGVYRYVWAGPDGETMGMTGTYQAIEPTERLVSTEEFDDGFGMGKMLVTVDLIPDDDRTRMHQTILFQSKAERDAAVATGMTEGMGQSLSSLDRMLAEERGS